MCCHICVESGSLKAAHGSKKTYVAHVGPLEKARRGPELGWTAEAIGMWLWAQVRCHIPGLKILS